MNLCTCSVYFFEWLVFWCYLSHINWSIRWQNNSSYVLIIVLLNMITFQPPWIELKSPCHEDTGQWPKTALSSRVRMNYLSHQVVDPQFVHTWFCSVTMLCFGFVLGCLSGSCTAPKAGTRYGRTRASEGSVIIKWLFCTNRWATSFNMFQLSGAWLHFRQQ